MSVVHTQSETVIVEIPPPPPPPPEYPVASKYERVHFVAHCRFGQPNLKALEDEVKARVRGIEEQVAYRCYFKGVESKGLAPLWLDVDFVFDLPAESPVEPVTIGIVIAVLGMALGISLVLFLWWTVWHEESEIFYCDQCEGSFQGRADYDAHLRLDHPEKWEYIEEQREEAYWWIELLKQMPLLMGMMLLLALVSYIPKPKREEE